VKVNGLLSRRLNPFVCVIAAFSSCPQPLARSRADVLRHAATLAKDEALQAAMLFANAKFFPNRQPTTFDEVFAIRVLMDHELDDSLMKDSSTMPLDETRDCRLDLKKALARAVLDRQVKEQMAMHDV
jgi:hypothetical protein